MARQRLVAALLGDGRIGLVEEPTPELQPGAVLVEVHNSLVSPGTELGGWRGLRARRDHPELNASPRKFGYSNAGVVLEVSPGVDEFRPGDRVACIGGGYALHTNYAVVPHHLCVALPPEVTFAQGSYAMLAATGLHAVRRTQPELGEYASVVGMGPVGQLTARLLQLAGMYVVAWDLIPLRLELARRWGVDGIVQAGRDDEVSATLAFTRGQGLDASVFALAGDVNEAFEKTFACLKLSPDTHRMGRIVLVGGCHFTMKGTTSNVDVRRAARTGSGYHDEAWEFGPPYPPVFMRWTTRTNLALCMRLIAEGRLDVDVLTTHVVPLLRVEEEITALLDDPDRLLGVVFSMDH